MYISHYNSVNSGSLKVSLIMFFFNMVDYPVFFPMLSTLTWDTVLTPRGDWGFYQNWTKYTSSHHLKVVGCGGGVGWPKILVSAPVPLELIGIWVWLGWGRAGFGDGLDKNVTFCWRDPPLIVKFVKKNSSKASHTKNSQIVDMLWTIFYIFWITQMMNVLMYLQTDLIIMIT